VRYQAFTNPTKSGPIELHIYRVGEDQELIGVTQSISDSVTVMVAMVRDYLIQSGHRVRLITIHHQVVIDR
jgi:hypothetical protein